MMKNLKGKLRLCVVGIKLFNDEETIIIIVVIIISHSTKALSNRLATSFTTPSSSQPRTSRREEIKALR